MSTKIKISELVSQALYEMGEQTTHLYERGLYHALQFVKKTALDRTLFHGKYSVLPVEKNWTVKLPPDCIDTVKVFYMDGTRTREIYRTGDKAPGRAGHYVLDEDRGLLLLPSDIAACEVMVEFVTAGVSCTADTCVHPYLEDSVLTYIYWKSIDRRRDYTRSDKEHARAEHVKALRQATLNASRYTVGEFLTAARAGYGTPLKG